jgi:hypothetical protein
MVGVKLMNFVICTEVGFAIHPNSFHCRHDASIIRLRFTYSLLCCLSISNPCRWGNNSLLMKSKSFLYLANSSCRFSRRVFFRCFWMVVYHCMVLPNPARNGLPAGCNFCQVLLLLLFLLFLCIRIRKNKTQVSSSTYCNALAQFDLMHYITIAFT